MAKVLGVTQTSQDRQDECWALGEQFNWHECDVEVTGSNYDKTKKNLKFSFLQEKQRG